MSAKDLFWEDMLAKEKERLAGDQMPRDIPVSEILLGSSSDDDVPIAAILESKANKNPTRKKLKKKLWEYVQVAEPTGVASKYWDGEAPVERATKRVAKQRISEIQDGELDAAILPDGKVVSLVPDVGVVTRKEKTKQRISELIDGELDAAMLPDGNVVSLVPDVGVVTQKEKTMRTTTQRRSDLQAFMQNQGRIDLEGETGEEREARIDQEELAKNPSILTVGMARALGNLSPGFHCKPLNY
jgi:hypothetical protein